MNKKIRIGLTLLIAIILLLALTVPGMAKKASTFTLTYEFDEMDWDNYTGEGTFDLVAGTQFRSGDATVSWTPRDAVKKGEMTFTNDGPKGSVSIQFAIPTKGADTCASGSFRVIETSGEYAGMRGTGTIIMCRDGDTVLGSLEGWAKSFQ